MRVLNRIPAQPGPRGRALTLGVFDGVHSGHVHLLRRLHAVAAGHDWISSVLTFTDHPHTAVAPQQRPPRLASPEQCLDRFRHWGVDEVIMTPFTQRLARTEPADFVRSMLIRRLNVKAMVIGGDFRFGRGGRGRVRDLKALGKQYGFTVHTVPVWRQGGLPVRSTRIRLLVAQGRVALARQLLGWPYTLHGRVVTGEGRGRKIGLPTANLRTRHEIIPRAGIYAVRTRIHPGAAWYPGLCHIGPKPTFGQSKTESIEIHIPGWQTPLYSRYLSVEFYARLRGVRMYPTAEALKQQVVRDWKKARSMLLD
jgi:riboflavin kinase / FMN adenylyltransferase